MKPLLLMDIDGVLNFFGPPKAPHHHQAQIGRYTIRMDRRFPDHLRLLETHFEIHWATMWQEDAASEFAPVFGYGEHLPYIDFDNHTAPRGESGVGGYKLPAIKDLVGDRPFVWVDDDAGLVAIKEWVARRNKTVPTKVIVPEGRYGMLPKHFREIRKFLSTATRPQVHPVGNPVFSNA